MNAPEIIVTEQHISDLVHRFYDRARNDEMLGPIFAATINNWEHHYTIVENFWSRTLLGTARYEGSPYPAHVGIGIEREHFDRWLDLFRATAHESLPPAAADAAIARAEHMAVSFRAGLFPFDPMPRTQP